ncbi:hypothetical protein HQ520_18130 [bacterium]|nr:hypothetical protein [bacterium]
MTSLVGFIGKHDLRIDDKGRLSIPARFKSVLQEKYGADQMEVIISVSLDTVLRVQPVSEYNRTVAEFMQMSDLDEETRRIRELYTGLAAPEKVDGSGRIRIPADLREIAQLDREVTCVGTMNGFDIWPRERWAQTQAETLRNRKQLIEQVREKNRRAS